MSKNDKTQSAVNIIPKKQVEEVLSDDDRKILQKLEHTAPKLSDEDIKRIANQIAADMVEYGMSTAPVEKKTEWKQRLTKLAYDIGIGLASSGIWAGVVYAASKLLILAGPEETDEQTKIKQRLDKVRAKLAQELNGEELLDLNFLTYRLESELASPQNLRDRLLETDEFQQFLAAIKEEDERTGIIRGGYDFDKFSANAFNSNLVISMRRIVQNKLAPPDSQ